MKILTGLLVVALVGMGSLLAAQPSSAAYNGATSPYAGTASPGPTDPNAPSGF